jgi:hypothetical protein
MLPAVRTKKPRSKVHVLMIPSKKVYIVYAFTFTLKIPIQMPDHGPREQKHVAYL